MAKQKTISEHIEEAMIGKPKETMSEGEAAEVLLSASLRLIGKAEFGLWRCDEKDCESCEINKKAILRLKENCELLMAFSANIDRGSYPSAVDVDTLDSLTETVNFLASKAFPELDPHNILVI